LEIYRKTYANIHLSNIEHNVREITDHFNDFDYYFGVVKADCYGHKGIEPVKSIIAGGVNYLAVIELEEALYIRSHLHDIPILCMGVVSPEAVGTAVRHNITLTINSLETLNGYLKTTPKDLKVHIKINTGMNRLGLNAKDELSETLKKLSANGITVEGIYTHIYNAYSESDTQKQFELFEKIPEDMDLNEIPIRHIQASDALCKYEKPSYVNACRLGIIMYGLGDTDLNLKSSLSLHSEIIQIHHLTKGENVGYGDTYHAPDDEIIAVVPIGYADGIIRKNTGRHVYINDMPCPIVGNICMDHLFVRIDDTIKLHDEVLLIKDNNHIERIAKHLDTISYEVLTSIGSRVPRVYK